MDRKKVIEAAEICLRYIDDDDCPTECPYFDLCAQYEKRVVFQPLIRDALALLKEQEAVEPKHNPLSPTDWFCGKCGMCISRFHDYCPSCGQAVKWE